MATKKITAKKADKTEEKAVVAKSSIILGARITEKAANLSEKGAYTFNVAPKATKSEIKKAIKALYKVTPVSVRTVTMAKKTTAPRGRKGRPGTTAGGKKAYVYLKKGDKIEVL
jgi:large subunit ribosomal protein L23